MVARVVRELRNVLPAWVFLLLSFTLLRLTQVAVLLQYGASVLPPSQVVVGSLLVAKALVTVDSLHLFSRLETRPVIVAAALRTALYLPLVFVFQYLEALVDLRRLGLGEASREFAGRLGTLLVWVIQLWLAVLLFGFSVARTFSQRLGRPRFWHILIGRPRNEGGAAGSPE